MSEGERFERIARLILRHGEDAAQECMTTALDLAAAEGADSVRATLDRVLNGGIAPEPAEPPSRGRGAPRNPEAGLIAVWGCVEATREQNNVSAQRACELLCMPKGPRRKPAETGVAIDVGGRTKRWDNPATLYEVYKKAKKCRDNDPDFCNVCDLCLPEIRTRLFG